MPEAHPLFPAPANSRHLVVVRAGRASLHCGWIDGPGRAGFDLLVARYEPGPSLGERDGHAEVVIPGRKVAGFARLFREHPALLADYDFIALFDDDLRISQRDLERLFEIGRSHKLDIFQPTLSPDSYFSYAATLSNSMFRLRYTNVVEMMCPVFSRDHLVRALPLFGLGYELGIDLIWTRMTAEPWFRYALVDAVVARHTRPVGSNKVQHLPTNGGGYDDEIRLVLAQANADFRGFVAYAAIDRNGGGVLSRSAIGLRSMVLWRAIGETPLPKRQFARFLCDYLRHSFLRPINLGQVVLGRGNGARSGPAAPRVPAGECGQ